MPARVNLYLVRDLPPLQAITAATGLPGSVIQQRGDGHAVRVPVLVAGARVELAYMDRAELAAHLEVLRDYVRSRYRVEDRALPALLTSVLGAITVTVEPDFDGGGACERMISAIASRLDAIVLRDDGAIEDSRGRALAYPVVADDEDDDAGADAATERTPPGDGSAAAIVARRALILAALAWRSWLEVERGEDAGRQQEAFDRWIEKHGLREGMNEREKALASAAPGAWSEQDVIDRSWGIEGAAVLAWALGLAELPPHDVKASPREVAARLGLFEERPAAFSAKLRPKEEIVALSARLVGISWRLHEFATSPGSVDFVGVSNDAWFGAFDLEGVPIADGDLAVGGEPISRAGEEAVATAQSIAVERHRAVSWLRGLV